VFWEGDFDVDELIAGALAVGARIVQSSALKLFTKPARFATVRSAILVWPVPDLTCSVDIRVNERVLLRPLIAALACR
jgi:hypothetical protein